MLSQKKSVSMAINSTIAVIFVVFGFVIPAIFLIGNHNASKTIGLTAGVKLTSAEVNGRTVFGEHCAVCHTLDAADAVGKTGPNLDMLKPSYGLIMHTLEYGCLADPSHSQGNQACLEEGNMPADIVSGADAVDVAKFVSTVAGHGT
jgi:mono/diheme cytochrome c family protein